MIPGVKPADVKAAAQRYGVPEHIVAAVHAADGGKGSPATTARSLSQYKARGVEGMLSAHHAGPAGGSQPKYVATVASHGSKAQFAEALARETRLPVNFVQAWMNHEQGSSTVEGGNNWLNIETGMPGGGSGPHGASAKEVERMSPQQAAKTEAKWLKTNLPSILGAKSPEDAVKKLEASGYAESHYGYESPSSFLGAAGNMSSSSSSSPSGGASPEAVQAVVAHAMGLPAGVRSQSGGTTVPNPKAGGLRLLAAEYRSSDPMLAELLETRAGEGTVQGLPRGVVSTAAGTPSTGPEAQSLVQAPPNLSKPARAPVKIDLGEAKRKYGGVPQPGKAVQEAKRSLENETGHPVSVQGVSEELKTHPGRLQEAMNRNYGHGPAQPHMKLPEPPPVVAHHPSGTVVKHPSGVPLYIPNQKRGRR